MVAGLHRGRAHVETVGCGAGPDVRVVVVRQERVAGVPVNEGEQPVVVNPVVGVQPGSGVLAAGAIWPEQRLARC